MNSILGMSANVKKRREELSVTELCTKCINCGLCIKSKAFEDMRKEQHNMKGLKNNDTN